MKPGVAFITGHSARGCTGLSLEQQDFQRRSIVPEENWIKHNFPWKETRPFPERIHLVTASWNNFIHFLAAQRESFRDTHRANVIDQLAGFDRIFLLAGSCGLELFNQLMLPSELAQKIHLFAYGPVSLLKPEVGSFYLLQGDRDPISRCFHRDVDVRYRCSHMGYLRMPETLQLFNHFYQRVMQT